MPELTGDPNSHSLESLKDGMTGTCLCGSITVKLTQKDLFTKPNGHVCHCSNCRKVTGAASSNFMVVPRENVELSDPKNYMKVYQDYDSGSGDPVPRGFCTNCGSQIGDVKPVEAGEKYAFLALGIFPRIPRPEFEFFVKHRHEWMKPVGEKQCEFFEFQG